MMFGGIEATWLSNLFNIGPLSTNPIRWSKALNQIVGYYQQIALGMNLAWKMISRFDFE